jgi:transposase
MKNKHDIIKQYNNNISIKKIAEKYNVTIDTIYKRLRKWGVRKEHGIKYLLSKCIKEI